MKPIVEQISEKVLAALQGISTSNGYSVDAQAEAFNFQRGQSPENHLILLYLESPSRINEQSSAGFIHWEQPYVAECFLIESESSSIGLFTRINAIRSDVEKAISQNPHWDKLAINTIVDDPEFFVPESGGLSGVHVRFRIQYRTSFKDPYSQAGS